MTIKFLTPYGQYAYGQIVTLDAANETALVNAKVASTDLTGGFAAQQPGRQFRDLAIEQVAGITAGSLAGRGVPTVLLGDSLPAYNNVSVAVSTITLSGGVITVVTGSAHQMRDGQLC